MQVDELARQYTRLADALQRPSGRQTPSRVTASAHGGLVGAGEVSEMIRVAGTAQASLASSINQTPILSA